MKNITLAGIDYLLVEIPNVEIKISERKLVWGNLRYGTFSKQLPAGNWEILGKADTLTWQDWVSIVEKENDSSEHLKSWWYRDYHFEDSWVRNPYTSGLSIVASLQMKPEKTLILKKEISNT